MSEFLQEGVVHFHVEVLGLSISKAIVDRLQFGSHFRQVFQAFLLTEVREIVRACFDA